MFFPTNSSQQYGVIGSTTSLTCAGSDITSNNAFVFGKDGTVFYSSNGGVTNPLKYKATVTTGQIKLQIKNTAITDEGLYSCTVNFRESTYLLQVDGKCVFEYCYYMCRNDKFLIFPLMV